MYRNLQNYTAYENNVDAIVKADLLAKIKRRDNNV
jgi:hypothetical protein